MQARTLQLDIENYIIHRSAVHAGSISNQGIDLATMAANNKVKSLHSHCERGPLVDLIAG